MVDNLHVFPFSFPANISVRVNMEPFLNILHFLPCLKLACFSHNFAMPLSGMLLFFFLVAPYPTSFLTFLEGVRQGFIGGDVMVAIPRVGMCKM